MIEEDLLKNLVAEGLSTYAIAKKTSNSQTNVRHFIKKYKITPPPQYCEICDTPLTGKKKRFCSDKCKNTLHQGYGSTYNAQKKRGDERKLKLVAGAGGKCTICGYNRNSSALEFHHRDPKAKDFKLDVRSLSNRKWEKIELEVKKCDLLCSNCHRELHYPLDTAAQP